MGLDHILAEWSICRAWLLPALAEDTEDDILRELLSNRAQLWRGKQSAMLTQLVAADQPNITVWLGGGNLQELLAMQSGMEAYARMQGCTEVRINGRPDWARVLRRAGFEPFDGELRKLL